MSQGPQPLSGRMPTLPTAEERVSRLLAERVSAGGMSGAALMVTRQGDEVFTWFGGETRFEGRGTLLTSQHRFYLTSITKALVFTAGATLLDEGVLDLNEPAYRYLPELNHDAHRRILVRHMFTHSTGLPEFLSNDSQLRQIQAPLSAFLEEALRTPLLFEPGAKFSYSNVGTHLMARIVEVLHGAPLAQALQDRVFVPAEMTSALLGWDDDLNSTWVDAKVLDASDHDHNSKYWREIGAPWTGAHATAADLSRLLVALLADRLDGARRLVSRSTASLISSPALAPLDSPSGQRFGLGWEIQGADRRSGLGALVPAGAFGHSGAAGTLMWADPASRTTFVLLTNGRRHGPGNEVKAITSCSNIVAGWCC